MDFAYATLVHLAASRIVSVILTVDHDDFETYRIAGRKRFTILPAAQRSELGVNCTPPSPLAYCSSAHALRQRFPARTRPRFRQRRQRLVRNVQLVDKARRFCVM